MKNSSHQRGLQIDNLEPRLLFSAAPAEAPADAEQQTDPEPAAAEESVVVTAEAAETAETTQEGSADESAGSTQNEAPAAPNGSSEINPGTAVNLVDLNPGVEEVNRETFEAIAEAAAERWRATGLTAEQSAALDRIEYVVEDLGGPHLGLAEGSRITIDDNAAGNLWFIDPTPLVDEEYTAVSESGTLLTAND